MDERFSLGMRLIAVLAALTALFAVVLYLSYTDADRMKNGIKGELRRQTAEYSAQLTGWYDELLRQHARELAAPFLWDVESLDNVPEGSPEFRRLQRRMYQFVYGQPELPPRVLDLKPVGPLESVLIVDREHRIVAASDPLVVDQRFVAPEEIAVLDAARTRPQLRRLDTRDDGRSVTELSVGVPNSRGQVIGVVRLRFVGGSMTPVPPLPTIEVSARPRLWGPLLAGLVALLGVGFGALATGQVISLARRIRAMAQGVRLPPARGPGEAELSVIEEKLDMLSSAVRREEWMVSSLSEALQEGVVLLDASGQLVLANGLASRLLQLDSEDKPALADAFAGVVGSNAGLAAVIEDGLARHTAVRERPLALKINGQDVGAQVTSYVLQERERAVGMVLVMKDRASIEALERNLREASRLEAIARLTGSVAHEVKNPLGAIGIHLELSRRQDKDPATEERVKVIREEIQRLREILEEWLRLTGPEERVHDHAQVDEVLGSVARLLRVEARHQGVELSVDRDEPLGRVNMPTAHLRQTLLNLALNALQAMPDGGKLTFRGRAQGPRVLLEVIDTGSGIPEEIRTRIFDIRFTTRPGGSGLGLAICSRLVEEAGGRLSFASEVGVGTTFLVDLPADPGDRDRQAAREAAGQSRLA
ncbi:MAG: hypothetical protein KBD01_15555 [Acidobacteria bacterium]|nr:hypothetical protein [Acidobacteriota bacterium]